MTDVLLPKCIVDELRKRNRLYRTGNEQGGLLLGYRKDDAIQVTSYTLPQKWDRATPFLFKRSSKGHKKLAHNEWVRSGKTIDWLGEWHTHPGGVAIPSLTDRKNWRHLVRHSKKPMAFLIFSDRDMYAGIQQVVPAELRELRAIEKSQDAILFG